MPSHLDLLALMWGLKCQHSPRMPTRTNRHRSTLAVLLLFSAFLPLPSHVDAALVNRTIDDQLGDIVTGEMPIYSPDASSWALGSSCQTCNIHPGLVNLSKTFDQTWHDTTHHPDGPEQVITVTFSGVAVYVFNIIANTVPSTTTLTNLSFTLDGTLEGYYLHSPDLSTDILYNVTVFNKTGLANLPHVIEIRPTGPLSSLILFDYILYTTDEETQTSASSPPTATPLSTTPIARPTTSNIPSPSPTPTEARASDPPLGAIVGGSVGGVVVVAILAVGTYCALRRRNRQSRPGAAAELAGQPSGIGSPPDMPMPETRVVPGPLASHSRDPPDRPLAVPPRESRSPSTAPPMVPISPTATDHARRYTELTDRIHILERQIGEPHPAPSLSNSEASNASRSTATRSQGRRALAGELATLRGEIAEVRALLEYERELSSEMMMLYHT